MFSVKTIKISDMGQFPGVVNAHREKKNLVKQMGHFRYFSYKLYVKDIVQYWVWTDYCCVILIDGFSIHSVNMYQTCLIFSGSPVTQLLLHQVFQQGLVQ